MAAPDPPLEPADGDRDYAVWLTIDEMLVEAADQIEKARHSPSRITLGWRMEVALGSLRCALRVHGDWFASPGATRKDNEEHV